MTTDTQELVSHVRKALGAVSLSGQKICVALSGGMDSVVLLHALVQVRAQVPLTLSALHVNHGISPRAADWAEFCRQTCLALDVSYEIATLPPLNAAGGGLERAAREARYAVFAKVDADVLCMAHHQNDRAETLLLNLFRGAGPQGLAAMPGTRFLNGKCLTRPFIDVPRATLHAWALEHDVRWIEDESNLNLHFRRNYMRHVVLPAVIQQFPGAVSVLARTAGQMQQQNALLARLAAIDAQSCEDCHGQLIVSELVLLPTDAMRNVLKYRLNAMGVHIPAARRLETLVTQLSVARSDSEILVRFGQAACYLWRDRLWLDWGMLVALPKPYKTIAGATAWPDGQLVIATRAESNQIGNMLIQPLGQGQRFHPAGRCRGVVSEMLRAQGVPAWVRPRLPTLWHEEKLCWIAGLGWAEGLEASTYPELSWMPSSERIL